MTESANAQALTTDASRLRSFASRLLRLRGALVRMSIAAVIAIIAVSLALPRAYEARATLAVQRSTIQAGGLAGIAADFGVSLGAGAEEGNPDFYAEVLRGRPFARLALTDTVEETSGARRPLVEYLCDCHDPGTRSVEREVAGFGRRLSVVVSPRTGSIEVRFVSRDPKVSAQVLTTIVDSLLSFDVTTRQRRAKAEAEFLASRLVDSRAGLDSAEGALVQFLRANREYTGSPLLAVQFERLQRRVSLQQQVQLDLARSAEQARIEEVRSTPLLSAIEPPRVPSLALSRHLLLRIVLGVFSCVLLVALGILFLDLGRTDGKVQDGSVEEFLMELRGARASVAKHAKWVIGGRRARGDVTEGHDRAPPS